VYTILRFAVGLLPRFLTRGRGACPPRQALEGFMRGQLGAEDNLRVLLHLVPGCSRCQQITAELWWAGAGRRGGRNGAAVDYGVTVDRVFDMVRRIHGGLEAERAAARRLLAGLAGLPPTELGLRLAAEARTWGLCELLLERSRDARSGDPREAEGLARVAAEIAGEIPAEAHPAELVEDLRGRAWIAVAEARRAGADLSGADEALRTADGHLARGSGERLEKARLYEARAALRGAQGRFREADRLLHRSIVLYRRTGQADLLGRAFVQQGYLRACAGDLPAAALSLRQGFALAGAARDPGTALAALYSLACLLHDGGRHREARALLTRIDPLWADVDARGRLRQLEGRITAALG
jgi:tetratricopeptide (TPR) repeat protein